MSNSLEKAKRNTLPVGPCEGGGQPLQRLRDRAAAVEALSGSPGLAGQSVVADMNYEFSCAS